MATRPFSPPDHPGHRRPRRFIGAAGRMGLGRLALVLLLFPCGPIVSGPAAEPPPPRSPLARQRATMASIRAVAAAWETYFHDFGTYCPPAKQAADARWGNITPEELRALLAPVYIERLPLLDGWERPLQFRVQCSPRGDSSYGIRSGGSNGAWDREPLPAPALTSDADADIVFADGVFLVRPAGLPK